MSEQARPRAFAVWFKDMERWDVLSTRLNRSFKVTHPLIRLGDLVTVRWEVIPTNQLASGEVTMVDKVGFDGIIYAGNKQQTRMDQYLACPGDLLVSKIRARQGSVGLVSPVVGKVSASIHYRALTPKPDLLDSTYAWLALRSSYCRAQFLAATGGAAKGEISEAALLNAKVPLPPLPVQQAIVARWEAAQADVKALRDQFLHTEGVTSRLVLGCLGVPAQEFRALPKAFALNWRDLERWSVGYIRRDLQGASGFTKAKYPIVPLSDCLIGTSNGYSIKPVAKITPYKMLKLNALTEAGLDTALSKYVDVSEATAARFSLHKGDLLLCRSVGSYSHVAKCALVEEDCPDILFPDIIIRVRFQKTVLPEYVREVIQTKLGRAYFQSNARTSVGMWKIGAEDIRSFPLPLPPLDVQREIVQQVQAQRQEMARLREQAERKARESKAEVEALILGVKQA